MAKGPSRIIAWDFRTPSFTILSDHQDDLGITHDRFCDLRSPEFRYPPGADVGTSVPPPQRPHGRSPAVLMRAAALPSVFAMPPMP